MGILFSSEWLDYLIAQDFFPEEQKVRLHRYRSFGEKIDLEYDIFNAESASLIYNKAKEDGDRSVMMQMSGWMNFLKAPSGAKVSQLRMLPAMMKKFVFDNSERRWLFMLRKGDLPQAVLFKQATFAEPRSKDDEASVTLQVVYNDTEKFKTTASSFYTGGVRGKTVEQILAQAGFILPTEELLVQYDADFEKFTKLYKEHNMQYRITGNILCKTRWWDTQSQYVSNTRAINDEEIHGRTFTPQITVPAQEEGEKDEILEVPVAPYIYLYNLDSHTSIFAHVRDIEYYKYDDSLRDKLVLPETHRDLLDILTNDMAILQGDIIDGKAAGTTILCTGAPGLGKTLTAEVYSEITHKPLYKVNSGQLGTTPADVEKSLEQILARAQRWGAVMLIDEADTYIRKRGDDIAHNAIVAGFLRTLEYFHGLLFLTTNRENDVDDAIVSRCIATIHYSLPVPEDAKKIWQIMGKVYQIELTEELLNDLITTFPSASGRDMRELCHLVARWISAKKVLPSIEVYKTCAQFRGLDIKTN